MPICMSCIRVLEGRTETIHMAFTYFPAPGLFTRVFKSAQSDENQRNGTQNLLVTNNDETLKGVPVWRISLVNTKVYS